MLRTRSLLMAGLLGMLIQVPQVAVAGVNCTTPEAGVNGSVTFVQSTCVRAEVAATQGQKPKPSSITTNTITLSPLQRWQAFISGLPQCQGDLRMLAECQFPPADPSDPAAVRPPLAAVRATAQDILLTLPFPEQPPRIGPDPEVNEWGMAVVGYPLWLWTEGATSLSTTTTAMGLAFTLDARALSTTFHLGDGRSVTCPVTQPYPADADPGTPSPVCGHTYEAPSLPAGSYTVTAVTTWQVSWSAAGYSGVLPAQRSASRQLPVGELQAVVVA